MDVLRAKTPREDEDFYQRFVARVSVDRIQAYTEASEDKGTAWRKDFDITYVRVAGLTGEEK